MLCHSLTMIPDKVLLHGDFWLGGDLQVLPCGLQLQLPRACTSIRKRPDHHQATTRCAWIDQLASTVERSTPPSREIAIGQRHSIVASSNSPRQQAGPTVTDLRLTGSQRNFSQSPSTADSDAPGCRSPTPPTAGETGRRRLAGENGLQSIQSAISAPRTSKHA